MNQDEWKRLKEAAEEAVSDILEDRDSEDGDADHTIEQLRMLRAVGYASDLTIVRLLMDIKAELHGLNDKQEVPFESRHDADTLTCKMCGCAKPRLEWRVHYFGFASSGKHHDTLEYTCDRCGYYWDVWLDDVELADAT